MEVANDETPTGRAPPMRALETCNVCRQRKVKCDRQRPACGQCSKIHAGCSYTERFKAPRTPKRKPTSASALAARLERMESLLRLQPGGRQTVLNDRAMSLGPKPEDEDHSATRSREPSEAVRGGSDSTAAHICKTLPPLDLATQLVDTYFAYFNNIVPIFEPETFIRIFRAKYSESSPQDHSWWACLNVVLAFGHLKYYFNMRGTEDRDLGALGYMENALSVVPRIAESRPSMLSVQALLGMVIYIQATPLSQSYPLLLATAMRFTQSLGLNRREAYSAGLPIVESEQRRRIFWISYFLDKDISMRTGHPPLQHDDDVDVDLPSDSFGMSGPGYLQLADGFHSVDFFRRRIQLAMIQSAIHSNLHSAKAARQSEEARSAARQELDDRLRRWKNSLPFVFDALFLNRVVVRPFDMLHIMALYCTYLNCFNMIHPSFDHGTLWRVRSGKAVEQLDQRDFSRDPSFVDAFRKALELLRLVPTSTSANTWIVLKTSILAILTLFRNIQIHPNRPTAESDFELANSFLRLFDQLAEQLRSMPLLTETYSGGLEQGRREREAVMRELMRMRSFCFHLRDAAKIVLEAMKRNWVAAQLHNDINGAMVSTACSKVPNEQNHEALHAKIKELIHEKAARDPDKARAEFIKRFETSFHENAVKGVIQPERIIAIPSEILTAMYQTMSEQRASEARPSIQNQATQGGNSGEQVSSSTPMEPVFLDSGLWNWWDVADMVHYEATANYTAGSQARIEQGEGG